MKKVKVTINFEVSGDPHAEDIIAYVEAAIRSHGGSLRPEDPMFGTKRIISTTIRGNQNT